MVQDKEAAFACDCDDRIASWCIGIQHDDLLADAHCRHCVPGCVGAIEYILHGRIRMGSAYLAHQGTPELAPGKQRGTALRQERHRKTEGESLMRFRKIAHDHRSIEVRRA